MRKSRKTSSRHGQTCDEPSMYTCRPNEARQTGVLILAGLTTDQKESMKPPIDHETDSHANSALASGEFAPAGAAYRYGCSSSHMPTAYTTVHVSCQRELNTLLPFLPQPCSICRPSRRGNPWDWRVAMVLGVVIGRCVRPLAILPEWQRRLPEKATGPQPLARTP